MVLLERATTDQALHEIIELQSLNLRANLSPEQQESQGFVTAQHTFEQLKTINDAENAVVATHKGQVVAYAIAMKRETGEAMPVFDRLFEEVDAIEIDQKPLVSFPYIFVGQLCVHKNFRGQGLVEKLYAFYANAMRPTYDFVITDISSQNPRSLKAHQNSGFKEIRIFFDDFTQTNWHIVVMDLRA
jgi:GNAT superfamily N-acetyltransferase